MSFFEMLPRTMSFCLELFFGEAVFLIFAQRRKAFPLRLFLSVVGYLAFVVLLVFLNSLLPSFSLVGDTIGGIVYFILISSLSVFPIFIAFDLKLYHALYIMVSGYSVEHIGHGLRSILLFIIGEENINPLINLFVFNVAPYLGVAILFFFIFYRREKANEEYLLQDKRIFVVATVNLFICIILSIFSSFGVTNSSTDFISSVICKLYAITSCTLCLFLQMGFFRENHLNREKEQLKTLLSLSKQQHDLSKQTIDYINLKCHDLKYQIKALKEQTSDRQAESIDRLSEQIIIYDCILKTGNETLDLVLMEKKLTCENYGIQLMCMADGEKIHALEAEDIYSLFGNMLDNAIECVKQFQDKEKKWIQLSVAQKKEMVYICCENYNEVPPIFVGGLPKSTKGNEIYHGFGVKSIKYIVEKYGGDVAIDADNHCFRIQIVLPE